MLRRLFQRAIIIIMLVIVFIGTYATKINSAYAYDVKELPEIPDKVLSFTNLYRQDSLSADQRALWNNVLTAYDSGIRGTWECEAKISTKALKAMKKTETLRSMNRVWYADSMNDVFLYARKKGKGDLLVTVDLDELGKQMEISAANEQRLVHMLNACKFSKETTQEEACRMIHDIMAENYSYDTSLQKGGMSDFFNGSCVCAGFARVYQAACLTVGIDCRYVTGTANEQYHAWNTVILNGTEYNVDVTWDCTNHTDKFYMMDDEEFESTHVAETVG